MLRSLFIALCSGYGVVWSQTTGVSDFWQGVGAVLLFGSVAYAVAVYFMGDMTTKISLGAFVGAIWLPLLMVDTYPKLKAVINLLAPPIIGAPILIATFALMIAGVVGFTNVRHFFRRRAFGQARWGRVNDLKAEGMTKAGGLFLGQVDRRDIYHNDEGHILTIGGTGGGKSSGLVVPTLLTLTQGSVIVTDPSGELTALTKRRRAEIGSVIILNPFQAVFEQESGHDFPDTGFNPMSIINPNLTTFKADCDALARYLMVTDRKESGSYWNDEGMEFLSLVIAATILYEDKKHHNLVAIYSRVRDGQKVMIPWMKMIASMGHQSFRKEAERFLDIMQNAPPQWQGISSKAAQGTKRYAPGTPLGEHVRKNGFDATRLKRENVTVFILVPSAQLATALPWMNTIIGVFGIEIGRPAPARHVTLLIDEAPALGYLPDLIPFMSQFRKAGLRVWLFTQTMAQLAADELYGATGFKAIDGLCSIKQYFAIKEKDLQKDISEACGERTVSNISANTGGASIGDVGVKLILPEEVRGLKKWQQILIIDKIQYPVKGCLVPYFKRDEWKKMAEDNIYL